jgi:hypothetical protein
MATRHNNFGRVFVHTNDAFGDFEDFQRRQVDIGDNFNVCGFQLVKRFDTWPRNEDEIVGSNLVEITLLANIFGEFAV